jgi:hypothetical protein
MSRLGSCFVGGCGFCPDDPFLTVSFSVVVAVSVPVSARYR